jgi:hypothetical protein
MNYKNLSVLSVVKKQQIFGATPRCEVKHMKKWPEGSAEAANK